MITDFHFLRPWWFLSVLPLLLLAWRLWRHDSYLQSWSAVCEPHLLAQLIKNQGEGKGKNKRQSALLLLFSAISLMIFAIAGPTWKRLPVPAYQHIQPRVIVLDLSENMLATDITPNRLARAKFKLHDLFNRQNTAQFGLVVYTGEPFVVSPLTEDAKTIDTLLNELTPEIMPLGGQNLAAALQEGSSLITQAGFTQGQLLILTASTPNATAVATARNLAIKGIYTSVMPMAASSYSKLFEPLASAGKGTVLALTDTTVDLDNWLQTTITAQHFKLSDNNYLPQWRDEGRLFLLPALALLLVIFRRGWLQRIDQ